MAKNNTNTQTPAVIPNPKVGTAAPAVTPDQSATVTTPTSASAPTAPVKNKVKMVKVKLDLTKELKDDVFVSVNDKKYQIKRGVYVEVPWFVAEVLNNQEKALMTLFENQTKAQQNVL